MIVKEIMTDKIVTIDGNESILVACNKFCDFQVGCLIVTENNQFAGLVTEHDLVERAICEKKDTETTKIKEVMTTDVKTIHPLDQIEKAVDLMRNNNIKKLPVVANGKLVGVVTITDIAYTRPGIKDFLDFRR